MLSAPAVNYSSMNQIPFILDQLQRAFDGGAWHGPALLENLKGVEAATAAAHPVANSHSIWELVAHLAGWERVIITRLKGKAAELSDKENFSPPVEISDNAWKHALQQLCDTHAELLQAVSKFPESRLNEIVPGRDYDFRFMLYGAAQHAAYHGGQIAMLRK
jgi:uncharacterized damage-inducible protein DinB